MKKYFILILFLIYSLPVKSGVRFLPDSTKSDFAVSANYHYGFIIAHRDLIVPFQKDHVNGFEFSISKPTNGKKVWQQVYNYPSIGLKYLYFDLGNEEQLGYGQAVVPYFDFRLFNTENSEFRLIYGWGMGYIEKPFNLETNYKNLAIGSHLNAAIHLAADLKVKLFRQTILTGGLNLTHFSNGTIVTPNLGINVATVKAGITYYIGKGKPFKRDSLPPFVKQYRNTIYLAGGVKQIYPVEGPEFNVFALSAARLKQFTRKSALGLALDLHYDNSLVHRTESDSVDAGAFKNGVRAGLSVSYELIFSDFSLTLQMGGYFYNQLKSDGNIYQRLGLRYQFYKNYFACFHLKSHWAKADFFEWGLGIRF